MTPTQQMEKEADAHLEVVNNVLLSGSHGDSSIIIGFSDNGIPMIEMRTTKHRMSLQLNWEPIMVIENLENKKTILFVMDIEELEQKESNPEKTAPNIFSFLFTDIRPEKPPQKEPKNHSDSDGEKM